MAKKATNVPARRASGGLPATGGMNLRRDMSGGKKQVDVESLAMPFMKVLQKTSPEVDEASGKKLKGAKEGMFFETTSQRMHPGQPGISFIPCNFRRRFIWWGPKFGQFKGMFTPEDAKKMQAEEKVVSVDNKLFFPLNGKVDAKKCDRLVDTREHYIILMGKGGIFQRLLYPLASTQIKKSRHLNSALDDFRLDDGEGSFSPATFAHVISASTAAESNDDGTWFGVNFALDRLLEEGKEDELYAVAKAFSESVDEDKVNVNYNAMANDLAEGEEKAERSGRGKV